MQELMSSHAMLRVDKAAAMANEASAAVATLQSHVDHLRGELERSRAAAQQLVSGVRVEMQQHRAATEQQITALRTDLYESRAQVAALGAELYEARAHAGKDSPVAQAALLDAGKENAGQASLREPGKESPGNAAEELDRPAGAVAVAVKLSAAAEECLAVELHSPAQSVTPAGQPLVADGASDIEPAAAKLAELAVTDSGMESDSSAERPAVTDGVAEPNSPPAAEPNSPAAEPDSPVAEPNSPAAKLNSPAVEPKSPVADDGGSKKRKGETGRWIITEHARNRLEEIFKDNRFPSLETRKNLAEQLSVTPRQVQVWFQNKRQRPGMSVGAKPGPKPREPSASTDMWAATAAAAHAAAAAAAAHAVPASQLVPGGPGAYGIGSQWGWGVTPVQPVHGPLPLPPAGSWGPIGGGGSGPAGGVESGSAPEVATTRGGGPGAFTPVAARSPVRAVPL